MKGSWKHYVPRNNHHSKKVFIWLLLFLSILLFPATVKAVLQKCTICHSKPDFKTIDNSGKVIPLFVDEKMVKKSVHAKKSCTECHADVVEIPHRTPPKKVNCIRCHYVGNPEGAPEGINYDAYKQSVHGMALTAGNPKAPNCQECHGSHDIRSHRDPTSNIYRLNIPKDCGKCHAKIYAEYLESIHGEAVYKDKNLDAPVCNDCHGKEHSIKAPQDLSSRVSVLRISESCSECHAAIGIVGKYGIDVEKTETYRDSFHGVANKFGLVTVANCASCHGIHDIRRQNDPRSSVAIENIPRTCGKCHPGANTNYAKGKIHVNPKSEEAGVVYYIATFFKWLTILTMLALVIHIFLDLNRKSRDWRKKRMEG